MCGECFADSKQMGVGCYYLRSRSAYKLAYDICRVPGAWGTRGLCALVKDKVSVKGGAQRGSVLGRDRTSSGSLDAGRIEQRLFRLGSGE